MRENQAIEKIVNDIAVDIGNKAYWALLEEVYTTPKPGLVDRYSCGAHQDMNVHTFEKSAQALAPYFIRMAAQGYELICNPEKLFLEIRKTGVAAEKAMYHATNGVNTHKGLIFTLGIFCAAAGRCLREFGKITIDRLIHIEKQMTVHTLIAELSTIQKGDETSHGEKNFLKYGTLGIRGEAILGYPSVVMIALPVLQQGIFEHRNWNQIKIQALFTLMSQVEDSNILARKGPETLYQIHEEANQFLERGGAYSENAKEELLWMDAAYIRHNISPGGCADLLATAIFLEAILRG